MVANTPEWVKKRVGEEISKWRWKWGIEVTSETEDRLKHEMTAAVDFVIRTVVTEPEAFHVPLDEEKRSSAPWADRTLARFGRAGFAGGINTTVQRRLAYSQ